MKFTTTLAVTLSMVNAITAMSSGDPKDTKLSSSPALNDAKAQCGSGDISCCDSSEEFKGNGILGNLLAGGLLNGLLGNSNSACAKTSLIDELNILAQVKTSESGPVCKAIIACCPEGTKECIAVDNSKS